MGRIRPLRNLWPARSNWIKVQSFLPIAESKRIGQANLRVGSGILADLIEQHGRRVALQRYLGTGTDDGSITPGGYASKILALDGER